jgi:glycosyltransferase involved in cell wall biosynthesis
MKRILICSGIYPPDMGGPANYAKQLNHELSLLGYETEVATFRFEKKLPTGLRHLWFFFKILPAVYQSDVVILLDTFSVAVPGVTAARLFKKKTILRTGGDFLWEAWVERTKKKVLLGEFYPLPDDMTRKEKVVYDFQKYVMHQTDIIAFSTEFQRDIFIRGYDMDISKTRIVENFFGPKQGGNGPTRKNFVWAGRRIEFKNLDTLKAAFELAKQSNPDVKLDMVEQVSREELIERMKDCYAVIYPSLTEISPNQILEAMMCNKPFIVTRDVGFYHRIKDVGIFVDPRSPHGIAEAVLSLAKDDVYAQKKQAVESFTHVHTYADIAKDFEKIINEMQ